MIIINIDRDKYLELVGSLGPILKSAKYDRKNQQLTLEAADETHLRQQLILSGVKL